MLIPFFFQSPNRWRSWLSYACPTNVNHGQGCICKDESMIRYKSCVKMTDIFFFLKKQRYYYVLPTLTLCDEIKADERGGSYMVQEDCRVKRHTWLAEQGGKNQ